MAVIRACIAAAALAAVACASGPPNWIAEGHAGAAGVRRILLGPLNLLVALRPEIQSGARATDQEIVAYLERQDRAVERVGLVEGRETWRRAIADAKAAGAPSEASARFVRRLSERHDFDALVLPSLLLHQVPMDASNASWDGVSRRMRMLNKPVFRSSAMDQSTLADGVAYGGISGKAWVTSLHVLVLARDGQRVFEGRGGIEFLYAIDLINGARGPSYNLIPNGSLFVDRTTLREGVVLAFAPYLTPPDG